MDIREFMPQNKLVCAVLACGGKSERMGENKLLIKLRGKSVIRRSAEALRSCEYVKKLIVAAPPELFGAYKSELSGLDIPIFFAEAGETRTKSVANAAKLCDLDIIMIHDGARPLVPPEDIRRSVEDCFKFGSSVVCTPVKDTLRFYDGEKSLCPERSCLYTVRTPQTFSSSLFKYALERRKGDYTDDAQLIDELGIAPHITIGGYKNIKLTTREDIAVAEEYLGGKNMRIGQGYDVHKLVEGRRLILGGVDIPHEKSLLGHSDADVLVHAIMDSLLGAAALGDIGKLFPDTDPKYSGANSLSLLKEAVKAVRAAGYEICNIDATVVAQAPKLSPHIPKMIENIAGAAGIPASKVSVKATTEEGLGFSGRKEGIAAQAVCLLE